jgi:solute carrier family 25 citrate transporter 1
MSSEAKVNTVENKKKISPFQHLLAGGTAGFVESSVCHPLDTVKTRMQLTGVVRGSFPKDTASPALGNTNFAVGWKGRRHRVLPLPTTVATYSTAASLNIVASGTGGSADGIFGTVRQIIQRQGPTALYQGLTAVYTGIIPKMAIRFVSFEHYKDVLGMWHGRYVTPSSASANDIKSTSQSVTFLAGLLAGLTEAVVVVTPAEVCKIRLQSHDKYKNVVQTAALIVKEEGPSALYKGVVPTMIRNGSNVAVNFTAFDWGKRWVLEWKRSNLERDPGVMLAADIRLDQWQTLLVGGLAGGVGPLVNNPLDVVKTRMQKQVVHPGQEPKYNGLLRSCVIIAKEEGTRALWKGITPRLMRLMPGQAITFTTYEAVTERIVRYGLFD